MDLFLPQHYEGKQDPILQQLQSEDTVLVAIVLVDPALEGWLAQGVAVEEEEFRRENLLLASFQPVAPKKDADHSQRLPAAGLNGIF